MQIVASGILGEAEPGTALPDGDVLVVYYAGEPKALDVGWAKLRV